MRIGEILGFGIFDSTHRTQIKKSKKRKSVAFEFEYIISADGTAILDGKEYALSPDSFLLAKPNQLRETISNFKCLFFYLALNEDNEYYALLSKLPDYSLLINKTKCKAVMKELLSYLISNGYDPECDFINAKLLELFYYLKNNAVQNENYTRLLTNNDNEVLPKAIEYIQAHYHEKLTLKNLAGLIGYSPNYFHSVFSKIMGITPQEYITQTRLSQAKYQLVSTTKNIATIATDCGFSSQSHFCLTFKKYINITPYQYRKLNDNYLST